MVGSDEPAASCVNTPLGSESACTAVCSADKSVLMLPIAVACVCRVVWSACQAVNCPLWAVWIWDTTEFTSIPLPFNRFAALKLIPMSFSPFASGCCGDLAGAQFRRFLRFLGDSALHAKFLVARHLQNHIPG